MTLTNPKKCIVMVTGYHMLPPLTLKTWHCTQCLQKSENYLLNFYLCQERYDRTPWETRVELSQHVPPSGMFALQLRHYHRPGKIACPGKLGTAFLISRARFGTTWKHPDQYWRNRHIGKLFVCLEPALEGHMTRFDLCVKLQLQQWSGSKAVQSITWGQLEWLFLLIIIIIIISTSQHLNISTSQHLNISTSQHLNIYPGNLHGFLSSTPNQ